MKLQNKSILITGGSSGIGLEAVKAFLKLDMSVIVAGKNREKNNKLKKEYPEVTIIHCDIRDSDEIYAVHRLVEKIGGIDVLYNNAAFIKPQIITDSDEEFPMHAQNEINTNYLAVVQLIHLFLPMLKQRKEAAIINTTSAVAEVPAIFIPTYSASKAALSSYTISLREQLRRSGSNIKVFELIPPTVDTEVTRDFDAPKISTKNVVNALIIGIQKDCYTIRVKAAKTLYYLHRALPQMAFRILNR